MTTTEWSVVGTGLSYSPALLERGILQYRRQVRRQLQQLIRSLEQGLHVRLADCLPLSRAKRVRTPGGQWQRKPEADCIDRLIEAVPWWFTLRYWQGEAVYGRVGFWRRLSSSSPLSRCNRPKGGVDQLLEAIGEYSEACPAEGQNGPLDRLICSLTELRLLRGRGGLYGMLTNGLRPWVVSQLASGPLDELLLVGTVTEAAEAIAKELHGLDARYSPFERSPRDVDHARQVFCYMVGEGELDEAFAELLSDADQQLASLDGVRLDSWRSLAAAKLGIIDNAAEPTETLATIIQLPRRRSGLRRKRAAVG